MFIMLAYELLILCQITHFLYLIISLMYLFCLYFKLYLPNMLLEISGDIAPQRMKRQSQSKNNTQLWM